MNIDHSQLARPHPPARHPARDRDAHATSTASSPASRSSAASASRSATRSAAFSSRRSRARRSPPSSIEGALHEFTTIADVVEDVTDIILNLKEVVLKAARPKTYTVRIDKEGPGPVYAKRHPARRRAPGPEPRPPHRDARQEGPARRWSSRQRRPRLRARRAEQDADDAHRHHPDRRALLADPQGELHGHQRARRAGHRLRQAHARGVDERQREAAGRRRLRREDPEGAALDLHQLRGDRGDDLRRVGSATTSRSTRTSSARWTSSSSRCARRTACRTPTSRSSASWCSGPSRTCSRRRTSAASR